MKSIITPPLKITLLMAITLSLIVVAGLSGCDSMHFYSQAAHGHFSLMSKREPVEDVLNNPNSSPEIKEKLEIILAALDFAERELALPAEDQYRAYVDLERPYAVWNVVAAEELSLKPYQWCFPIVGCITYQGYFKKENALAKAQKLSNQGYDVYTRGVTAYSTIGWFNDPVLNTFIRYDVNSLRALIFHELAHQTVYLEGDSMFNESFAMAVEMEGMRQWYQKINDKDNYQAYLDRLKRKEAFVHLIMSAREQLNQLYQSDITDEEKRSGKTELIAQLRKDYEALRDKEWDGKGYYKTFFEGPLNNAQLNSAGTYYELVPGLRAMLETIQARGGTLIDFYQQCQNLESLSREERHKKVKAYMTEASGRL